LTQSAAYADYFEETARLSGNAKLSSNWIMGELSRAINDRGDTFETQPVTPARLAGLVRLVVGGRITNPVAKTVLERMYTSGATAEEIVAAKGLRAWTTRLRCCRRCAR